MKAWKALQAVAEVARDIGSEKMKKAVINEFCQYALDCTPDAPNTNLRVISGGVFTKRTLTRQLPLLGRRKKEAIYYVENGVIRWMNLVALNQHPDAFSKSCCQVFAGGLPCNGCIANKRVRFIKHCGHQFMAFPVLNEVDWNVLGTVLVCPTPEKGD